MLHKQIIFIPKPLHKMLNIYEDFTDLITTKWAFTLLHEYKKSHIE